MKRRAALAWGAAAVATPLASHAQPTAAAPKTLRVLFPVAETGFDPARVSDVYSAAINAHIFDAPLQYDYLARPVRLRPRAAAALPEHSADFRVWTVRLKPGIFFADDPAFKGRKRELVADDYVYSLKRFADPATKSPNWPSVDELKILGLRALFDRAVKDKKPFDYDTPIEGLRALDRYTFQVSMQDPQPRFDGNLALSQTFGALAREVVEHYGDKIMEHPVGTGPFRLAQWRRSSRIVLERNPNYRDERFDAWPAADDAEGQAILARHKGKRLPMLDRVEVQVVEEAQPRWLSFLNGEVDLLAVPQEFSPIAMPGGVLAPHLARRGVQGWRVLSTSTQMSFFNMEHPLVGGLEPERVALRRAVHLAIDTQREIDLGYRGMAIVAQSIIGPNLSGYDPEFRSDNSAYDPARARALLDVYGWLDRNRDGWREQPDGQPFTLEVATQADQFSRQLDELLKKELDAIGIRTVFKPAKWPENLKAARAGKLMFWRVGSSATQTDGQQPLVRLYGPSAGQGNLARFRLPAFDAVYERMGSMPDGPERDALFREAKRLALVYAPYKIHNHQLVDALAQPWVRGYRRPLFGYDYMQWVDVAPKPAP